MQNKIKHSILVLLVIVFSCKREKLSEDYSYLEGKWTWIHTYKNLFSGTFADYQASLSPDKYSIEISNKCFIFLKNGKSQIKRKFEKISIVPGNSDTSGIAFFIALNKNDNIAISYYPNRTYIEVTDFPYNFINSGNTDQVTEGDIYYNYFRRE